MRTALHAGAVVLIFAVLSGCSHPKQLSRDDLRSEVTKAVSLASETEELAKFVREGKSARHYAEEHASSLEEEVSDSTEKLAKAQPAAADEQVTRELKETLEEIAKELRTIQQSPNEGAALGGIEARAGKIRERLQRTKAAL